MSGFTKDIMEACVSCSSSGATAAMALATLSFFILIAIVVLTRRASRGEIDWSDGREEGAKDVRKERRTGGRS